MHKTLIIFDFWGAGNIGDDLMMDGFLLAMEQLQIPYGGCMSCLCAHDIPSQQLRFPAINWINSKTGLAWRSMLAQNEQFIGLGDTPFQLTCGDWFLNHLKSTFNEISTSAEIFFVNVGAEQEVLRKCDDFAKILGRVSRCSTRDVFSCSVLSKLGADPAKLCVGGDLANVSLGKVAGKVSRDKKFKLGVILGYDTLSENDLNEIGEFLRRSRDPVAFITGDCRDGVGFEYHLFRTWTTSWFSRLRQKLVLRRPNYSSCGLLDLIQPIAECDVVLSSRFHGLLAAAWLGCRVGALGRSSKVVALAKELKVPYVEPPFDSESIKRLSQEAIAVPGSVLSECRDKSLEGVLSCKFW